MLVVAHEMGSENEAGGRGNEKGRRVRGGPDKHGHAAENQDIRYPHSWMCMLSPSPTGCAR